MAEATGYAAFAQAFMTVDAAGAARLTWPAHLGAVDGSARLATVSDYEAVFGGRDFIQSGPATNGVAAPIDRGRLYGWSQLALPPHRQYERLHRYRFTSEADARLDQLETLMIVEAIAPAFGLPGGGMQLRWEAPGGAPVSPAQLMRDGVVQEVFERG